MKKKSKKNKIKTSRRDFIKMLIGISGVGLLGSFLATFKSVFPALTKKELGESPVFVYAEDFLEVAKKGEEAKVEHFKTGDAAKVLYKGDLVMLLKLESKKIRVKQGVDQGFIAYSSICTHLSCIPYYRKDLDKIYCPCHDGIFDPYDGAKVIAGPPPEPLPHYPVKIQEDGTIIGSEPIKEVRV